MRWVVERNLFYANDQMRFVAALKANASRFSLVDYVPFLHEILPEPPAGEALVAMGSTNFIRTAIVKGWRPGVWHNADFRFEVWRDRLGTQLLNHDGIVQSFGQLAYEGVRFLRPCEDLKVFTGTLIHSDQLESWKGECQQYDVMADENVLRDDTPVMVAEPKEIEGEFRFFIVGRRVVSGCRYKPQVAYDEKDVMFNVAWEFAEYVANQWGPADAYVMDVAEIPSGFVVIEYNCLNAAGLYLCPVEPIILAIEKMLS